MLVKDKPDRINIIEEERNIKLRDYVDMFVAYLFSKNVYKRFIDCWSVPSLTNYIEG